jgi:two-component system, OmpR family, alkaline phosphatase synthesis response regulator PhoP
MKTIYIVEDDKNISEIETFSLKNSGYEAKAFENASGFYSAISEKVPDLVLLDIMLPDDDGLTIIKKLRMNKQTKKLPVIMVTAKSLEIDAVKGLDSGADDYLTKPFGVMELISRVKALLRRTEPETAEKSIKFGEIFMDADKHQVYVNDTPVELTFKEYELLYLLLINSELVLKREVIMDRIWGIDFEGESRTLDMHIKTLRQKLGDAGEHIKTVRNVGYILK